MIAQLVREDGVEIRLELVLRRAAAASLDEIVDLVVVSCYAHRHSFQSFARVCPNHSNLVPQLLEPYRASIVEKPNDTSPSVYPFAYFGLSEHDLSLA